MDRDVPNPEEFLGEGLGTRSFTSEQAPLVNVVTCEIVLLCQSRPTTGDSKLSPSYWCKPNACRSWDAVAALAVGRMK